MNTKVINVGEKWKDALDKAIEILKIEDFQIGIAIVSPNTRSPPDGFSVHEHSHEFAYIIEGEIILGTDKGEIRLKKGDFMYNPPGTPHYTYNDRNEPCKLLWLLSPPIELHSHKKEVK